MCYQSDLSDIQPALRGFVRDRIQNEQDAFDIVQETNRVLINKQSNYDTSRPFKPWALGVAKWQILAHFKRIKRSAPLQSLDASDFSSNFIGINPNWLADVPFADLIKKERKELIKNLNHILSKRQRQIFNLLIEGFNNSEIANAIGTTQSNVQSTKSRLIERIRKFVANNNNEKYHNY